MKEGIAAEIYDLVRTGTFKVFMRAEIPPKANVLTARFVLESSTKTPARCNSREDIL